jgi:hypothetical protein
MIGSGQDERRRARRFCIIRRRDGKGPAEGGSRAHRATLGRAAAETPGRTRRIGRYLLNEYF